MQERDILNKLANVANAQAGDENKIAPYNKFGLQIGGFQPSIPTNAVYNPNKDVKKEKSSNDETKKDESAEKGDTAEIIIEDKEMPEEQLSPVKPTTATSSDSIKT